MPNIQSFSSMDWFILAGLVILGWLVGAVINYLSDVLPASRKITSATCPVCHQPRTVLDYVTMQPCGQCGKRRAFRAWAVELLSAYLTVSQWYHPSPRLGFWLGTILLMYFGVVAVIDIENRLIIHATSLFGALFGGAVGLWLHGLVSTLLGGLAGFGIMFFLYGLGWLLAKGMGKLAGKEITEDALGFGDIILSTVLGLLLGWPGIGLGLVYTIFIAGMGSLLIILVQLIRRKYQAFSAVAFGPYLLIAACLLLYMPK